MDPSSTNKIVNLPYSLEAERASLGSVILKNSLYEEVFPRVRSDDFYDGRHRLIVKAIESFRLRQGEAAFDILTIAEELKNDDQLKKIGGIDYLNELIDSVPTTSNVLHYAGIVKEKSVLRKIIEISERAIDKAKTNEESKNLLEKLLQDYFGLAGEEYHEYEHIQIPLTESIEFIEKNYRSENRLNLGILTGYHGLDKIIIGLRNSNLIIVGGRTGMGKTAFALNMLERVALGDKLRSYIVDGKEVVQKFPAGIFSLEMSKREICMRILSTQTGINLKQLISLDFDDSKWQSIIDVVDKVKNSKIYIDDTPGIFLQELVNKAKKMKKDGVKIIFIDYLQLIRVHEQRVPREQQISEISKQLKNLARELDIPIVALTQLNRSADTRDDKTPRLSDIRESGAIEQDADVVLFISDDYKKNEENDEDGNENRATDSRSVKLITVGKNRHGPTGTVKVVYEGQYLRFEDYYAHEF